MNGASLGFEYVGAVRKAPPSPVSSLFATLNQSLGIRATATVRQCEPKKRSIPRRLTLPSSGLAPAAQAWPSFHSGPSPCCLREPLMSNVRRRTHSLLQPATQAASCCGAYSPVQPGVMRPSGDTHVISVYTSPAQESKCLAIRAHLERIALEVQVYWRRSETVAQFCFFAARSPA